MFRVGTPKRFLLAVFLAILGAAGFQNSRLLLRAAGPPAQINSSDVPDTIWGQVRFQGAVVPQSTVIENITDPQICGSRQSFEDILISSASGGIQNVIVALRGVSRTKSAIAATIPF